MSVNKVILIGNLGNDPEIKYLASGEQVANFSLATSEQWNDRQTGEKREKTEWHRLVAFRRQAELIGQYCRKGSKVYIEGKLQTRSWTDPSGQTRYVTEILVDQVQFLTPKNRGADEYSAPYPTQNAYAQKSASPNDYPYAQPQGAEASVYSANYGKSASPAPAPMPEGFHADDDIPF